MKICPRCRKTYSDDTLNFCLEDGATLTQGGAADDSLPATVLINQPRPTTPNQSLGGQPSGQSGWNNPLDPNRSLIQPPPKKSKSWLWVLGILSGVILLCGGGLTGFIVYVASLENQNNTDADNSANLTQKSPAPVDKTSVQTVDLSKWVKGDTNIGIAEFENGEFLMGSKKKGYYYVLTSPAIYQTEDAATKVTVRNIDQESTALGFGLVIHSNPEPLMQDYAFLIDSETKKYRVVRHTPGDEIIVVDWTRSSAIKNGTEQNVLEVRDQNEKMNFYINGEFIKAVDNEEGYKGGVTGLYSGDAVQIAFSNLEIRK